MIFSSRVEIPDYLNEKPVNCVRLVTQDYINTDKETLRVTNISMSNVYEFTDSTLKKWTKWLRKVMKFLRKHFVFAFLMGCTLLAQKLCAERSLSVDNIPVLTAAISSGLSSSFKVELGTATHNFTNSTGDTFKVAMFVSAATLGASTTSYSSTNELTGTGYTAGGTTVTSSTPVLSGTTCLFDFTDASWTTATWTTANGCQLYNSSKSNKSVFVIAFGSDQSVTAGTFTIQWPVPDASNAIIRF